MYLKIIISIGIISALIYGCAEKKEGEYKTTLLSNIVSITDNEDKGIKEILDFYGGYCKYAVGVSASTDKENSKYFELEMSKSEVINSYSNIAQMPASNVAYLFYKNLKEEKDNYSEIHIVIILNNSKKMTFKYSIEQLEVVKNRMTNVNHIIELIKTKNFEGIKPILNDSSVAIYDRNELVNNMKNIDSNFGYVKEFLPYGFRFNELENGKKYLHISGAVMREKQNHEFSVDFDLDAPMGEVLKIEYKL